MKKFNPREQLTRGHIALDDDLQIAMIDVEWSKMIQYRERNLWLALRPASTEEICPLATLKKLFTAVRAADSDPCFSFRNAKNELKALTYGQLSEQLKEWVRETGWDPSQYMLHGMRRGSMMHAYKVGIDPSSLRILGDWGSDTYLRYIDVDMEKRVEAAVRFADNM